MNQHDVTLDAKVTMLYLSHGSWAARRSKCLTSPLFGLEVTNFVALGFGLVWLTGFGRTHIPLNQSDF